MQPPHDRASLFSRLCRMEQEIASSTDTDQLLARITNAAREIAASESASILLLDEERDELYFKETLGDLGETVKKVRVPLGHPSLAGLALRERVPQVSNDVANDPRHFKGVDEATAIPTRSVLAVPIVWGDEAFGVLEAINKIDGVFGDQDREMLAVLAGQAAVVLQSVRVKEQLQNFFVHMVEILVSAMESMEPGSQGHVVRVTRLVSQMARELGLSGKDYENLYYAAYFHDVGKLLLGSSLVARNDKTHPEVGAAMLARIQVLQKTAPTVRSHHERWDGSGFPEHRVGEATPLPARIVALAEDYDEHWMDRPEDQPAERFAEEFLAGAQGRHDPALLDLLRGILAPGVSLTPG